MANKTISAQDKKVINDLFWRSNILQGTTNVVVQQAHGVIYTLDKYLDEFYKDDPEEKKAAYDRHSVYFLTNPYTGGIVWPLLYHLEKKRSENREAVPSESIENIKIALMGPLAAVGDTLFQGSLGTIMSAMFMGMAQEGNILGPIGYCLIWSGIVFFSKYFMVRTSYIKGEEFISELLSSNLFKEITKIVSIVGLIMMGYMAATVVTFKLNWVVNFGGVETNIQESLIDRLLPGFWSLVCVFGVMKLIDKKVAPIKIIYGMMILCIILAYLHIV